MSAFYLKMHFFCLKSIVCFYHQDPMISWKLNELPLKASKPKTCLVEEKLVMMCLHLERCEIIFARLKVCDKIESDQMASLFSLPKTIQLSKWAQRLESNH